MSFEAHKRHLLQTLAMCYKTLSIVGKPCPRLLDMQMSEITEMLINLDACDAEAKAAIAKALTHTPG